MTAQDYPITSPSPLAAIDYTAPDVHESYFPMRVASFVPDRALPEHLMSDFSRQFLTFIQNIARHTTAIIAIDSVAGSTNRIWCMSQRHVPFNDDRLRSPWHSTQILKTDLTNFQKP